jgi:hopanoid biosynthesis associated RND transporter like protein HpnN
MADSPATFFSRMLHRLALLVHRRRTWFIAPQFLLAALCVWFTVARLEFSVDRNDLVGSEQEYHRNFLELKREFPGQDDLVAIVESDDPEKNRQFVERLGARLDRESTQVSPTNLFTDVFYKGDLPLMGPKALLFVPESDLKEMLSAIRGFRPFIEQFSRATNLAAVFHQVSVQIRSADRSSNAANDSLVGALPALERIVQRCRESMARPGIPPSPGVDALFGAGPEAERARYVTFDRGRLYLVNAKARLATMDELPKTAQSAWERLTGRQHAKSDRELENDLKWHQGELSGRAVERFRQLIAETKREVPGVNVGLTGEPVLEVDEMQQSQTDSTWATILSLILCGLLFLVGYNHRGRPQKTVLSLLVGLCYTMGYTTAVVGHLNILTITFAPMLIGLAIDFGVHLISRFEEEVNGGETDVTAITRAIVNTGQGIFTGCFTTAGAFFAMALTDFRGIQEMGVISGGGLLICLVPMTTLLPALLLREKGLRRAGAGHDARATGAQAPGALAPPAPADWRCRIERFWLDRPWWVLGAGATLSALCAVQAVRVPFDYNLLNMQSDGLSSVIFEKKLVEAARIRKDDASGDRAQGVLFGAVMVPSATEVPAIEARLKALPTVAGVDSMGHYLTQDSSAQLELIRKIRAETRAIRFPVVPDAPVDLGAFSQRLWGLQGLLALAADEVARTAADEKELLKNLTSLRVAIADLRSAMFRGDREVNARQLGRFQHALFRDIRDTFETLQGQDDSGGLREADLPAVLRNRFVGVGGRHLVLVYPKEDVWERGPQERFVKEIQSVAPRATGTPVQLYYYTELLKVSYVEAAGWALGAIVLLVFVHFRSPVQLFLALLPVVVGALWMVGFMGIAGIPFNPANIMTLPLVIGIGVTNGIHILNRFAEERTPALLGKSTGKAVLISGLTTIAGFGSLIIADHRGIRSLGWVMAVGTATCMIAAMTLLPALLTLKSRQTGNRRPGI